MPEASDIPAEVIGRVVEGTKAIEQVFGKPVDLEWVHNGQELFWVQVRTITALDDIPLYSNKISREVLPGLIKPLVWSVNVPLVNSAWVRLFTELIGKNDIDPNSLARSFRYQAYFNMGVIGQIFVTLGMPRESLELLIGIESSGAEKPSFKPTSKTFRHLPRMLKTAVGKLAISRKVEAFYPAMCDIYKRYHSVPLNSLSEDELLGRIRDLFELNRETAYFNIVVPLLMQIYNRLLKTQLMKCGVAFEKFDVTEGMAELHALDPNMHLTELNAAFRKLSTGLQRTVKSGQYTSLTRRRGLKPFHRQLSEFLNQFGHLSDSGNDFSSVPWRENPSLILKTITEFSAPPVKQESIRFSDLSVRPMQRPILKWTFKRARQFRLYREQISSLYTYGYGLFHDYFLALGKRFMQRGLIRKPDDIFYLHLDEVKTAAGKTGDKSRFSDLVKQRREEMKQAAEIRLPTIIYGGQPPPVEKNVSKQLTGIPTSRGYYTGPVRIIRGIGDFDKLQQGDVLVVPFSDIGWTPLFIKAGAVISESGGLLSHSSIVAREYGIAAVVSVAGACDLNDGITVSVDGFTGRIHLHHD